MRKNIYGETIVERGDGRIEFICEHGVGHTIEAPTKMKKSKYWNVHGCDGCCTKNPQTT